MHEKEWPSVRLAAAELGYSEPQLWAYTRLYRDTIGATVPNAEAARAGKLNAAPKKRATAAEKKEADRQRSAARRAALKLQANGHAGNGTGKHLALIPETAKFEDRIAELQAQNSELIAELNHALEHSETLQKLLMTVGKTL